MRVYWILFFLSLFTVCNVKIENNTKINGVSFVASRDSISKNNTDPVVKLNSNYVAIMPFGFLNSLESSTIQYNSNRQWFGETKSGVAQYIKEFNKRGVKVMLKPHIWIGHGDFTGNIAMKTEEEWRRLEASYQEFILAYAKIASDLDVDLFCIGVELQQFVNERPLFWDTLIIKIKQQYKNELTYASNWDEYSSVPFWKELDYIGIDAYFPVSDTKTPSVKECRVGWGKHKPMIQKLADSMNRKILFTEFGYSSSDYCGKEPWKQNSSVNIQAQKNAQQALFDEFWGEKWFAGGFVWKWFRDHSKSGGVSHPGFTPQNKPAEELIRKQYKSAL